MANIEKQLAKILNAKAKEIAIELSEEWNDIAKSQGIKYKTVIEGKIVHSKLVNKEDVKTNFGSGRGKVAAKFWFPLVKSKFLSKIR